MEEVRLAPKKKNEEIKISKIEAKDENFNFEKSSNTINKVNIE